LSTYSATVRWQRGEAPFTDGKYSRGHTWAFDGGVVVPASSSPHSVREPYSRADAVDPEEAFVASLSSCHMLWFLHLAAKRGFVVDVYEDGAEGVMAKNPQGRLAMTRVTLRPAVAFSGVPPSAAEFLALHHDAHKACFIANSVMTIVACEPRLLATES
jgi:organic hydroperoxide reductase OsmC/OhrA